MHVSISAFRQMEAKWALYEIVGYVLSLGNYEFMMGDKHFASVEIDKAFCLSLAVDKIIHQTTGSINAIVWNTSNHLLLKVTSYCW